MEMWTALALHTSNIKLKYDEYEAEGEEGTKALFCMPACQQRMVFYFISIIKGENIQEECYFHENVYL